MNEEKFWFAIYTKPKCEFKAAEDFRSINIEYYLPTITTLRKWSDRKKQIIEPVFKSYIFIFATEKERLYALTSPAVVKTISFDGIPAKIPADQIENVRKILNQKPEIYIQEKVIKAGTKVKITSGPFAGVEGIVFLDSDKHKMLAVSIDLLKRSIIIKLHEESISQIL